MLCVFRADCVNASLEGVIRRESRHLPLYRSLYNMEQMQDSDFFFLLQYLKNR